jgi:hypothetical protein
MLTLLFEGGLVTMLFILATGLVGLGAAFYFALRAQRQTFGFVKLMALTTLFGTLAASCADEGATLHAASRVLEKDPNDLHTALLYVVQGTGESTSPGILGFAFLALICLLAAVGKRRLDARTTAQ